MTMGDDFPWVQKRSECSLGKVFELLRQQVAQDVQVRQNVRQSVSDIGGRPNYNHSFTITEARDSFTVMLEGNQLHERVSFLLEPHSIKVSGTNGELMFEAYPSLNADGQCIVKVDRREYPLWYMRMLALEKLFFGII